MNAERDPARPLLRLSEEELDARADADFAAGRFVEHDKVVAWLKTWGTPEESPVPPEWLA